MPLALIVAEFGSLNGGEQSLLSTLPCLHRGGWTFQALVPAAGPFSKQLQKLGIVTHAWANRDNAGQRLPLDQLRQQISGCISSVRPDLVLANSLSTGRLAGPLKHTFPGTRFVGYLRDIIKLNQRNVQDMNELDRTIAVSAATRDFHAAQGLHAGRIIVVYNGVDFKQFGPAAPPTIHQGPGVRNELALPDSCPLILFVGQIGLRKGLDVWLQAAGEIARSRPDAHFLIVGARYSGKAESVEYESRLRHLAAAGCLAGRVHWLGRRDDVSDLMRQSSVLLHTARQEPLGRVLLEAFASGLPAVATAVGGTPEIFCDTGLRDLMVGDGAADAAAAQVLNLLDDETRHQQMSARVRELAQRKFCAERAAAKLARVLAGLCPIENDSPDRNQH